MTKDEDEGEDVAGAGAGVGVVAGAAAAAVRRMTEKPNHRTRTCGFLGSCNHRPCNKHVSVKGKRFQGQLSPTPVRTPYPKPKILMPA